MSAKFVDALKGYEFFLQERGTPTIQAVNQFLKSMGRSPIRERTFGHFGKLLSHGFRSYIPINQFDVFQTLGRLQLAADRRRHRRDSASNEAELTEDGVRWRDSRIVDVSQVGFGLAVQGRLTFTRGQPLWLRLSGYEDIPVLVAWSQHDILESTTRFGVRALEFVAKYVKQASAEEVERPLGIVRVYRSAEGPLHWDEVFRILEITNELLDALDALVEALWSVGGISAQVGHPQLDSIKFGSPGAVNIKIDVGVAEILKVIIEKVQFWSLDREGARHRNARLKLQNVDLRLDIMRKAMHLNREAVDEGMSKEVVDAILQPVRELLGTKRLPKGIFEPGTPERGVLENRLLPAVTELVIGDDRDFAIETKARKVGAPRRPSRRSAGTGRRRKIM